MLTTPIEPQSSAAIQKEQRWLHYLQRIAARIPDALSALYEESVPQLYGLALKILGNAEDAEEVILDVFQQVWSHAERYAPDRGPVFAWLVLLVRSRALDRLRRTRRHPENTPLIDNVATKRPGPEVVIALSEQKTAIRIALNSLPSVQREVIEMAYFSDLTQIEMAEILNIPLGTVKSRMRLAMKKLREALGHRPPANESGIREGEANG
jgi:RNA polymerase sigma-70 factor, ECF subfamily